MSTDVPKEALHVLSLLKGLPGSSIIGVYLHGSAAMGGLQRDSDVDVLAAVNSGLTESYRKMLTDRLLALSAKPGSGMPVRPLEVIVINLREIVLWRHPPAREYIFGEWLRERLECGEIPAPVDDPDLTLILAQALKHSVPLLGPDITDIVPAIPVSDVRMAMMDSLPGLMASVRGDERNVLLTLARMWYTAETGEFAGKDIAASWAMRRLPESGTTPLDTARKAYRGEAVDDWAGKGLEVSALVQDLAIAVMSRLGDSGNTGK